MLQELAEASPYLLRGIGTTLAYTAIAAAAALVLSFVFGLLAMSPSRLVRGANRVVVEFFRGSSLVIQLFWIYYVLPELGFQLVDWAAATVAFGLNFGAYGSEVVRGALLSVPKAQWEATVALGMSPTQRMRRIIMPQAIPEMIPPFGNLLVQILKSSSLLFLIAVTELTYEVKELRPDLGSVTAFAFALVVYFLIAQALVAVMRWWENRASARLGRGPKAITIEQVFSAATPTGGGTG